MDRGILGGVGEAPSGGLMSPAAIREYLLQEAERQRLGRASLDRDLAALRRPGMNVVPNVIEFAKANPVEAGLLGVGMSPVPVVSDVAGFAGDMLGMYNRPEDRTLANLGLAAAGLIPGLPALGALTFGGKGAKTADMVALARAEAMEQAGADAAKVWDETGWFRGADDKWRFEIPDNDAAVLTAPKYGQVRQFTEFANHPDLLHAYPDYSQMPIVGADMMGEKASYMRNPFNRSDYEGVGSISINPDFSQDARSLALHELQHAIQTDEGFAPGGSVTEFMKNTASEDEAMAMYRRVAGEVEARNVQHRMDMTPEQRRATPPWATEDVPRDQQIVRRR